MTAPASAGSRHRRARRSRESATLRAPITSVDQIKASEAILVDAASGQVLWERNADVPRPPASTTKIMTAILLLEHLRPDEMIRASLAAQETGGSSLHLSDGEQVTAKDMLYALMLRSANDGCVAVAEKIAGNESRFADMMNQKAHEIGATNTHFVNCNGLNCDGHVTTARDLSIMARYASRYPAFNAATHTKSYRIRRSTASKDIILTNHAKFLWRFPGADGVKTGWTVPAGHCFVGAATWNGWRLISVVMNSPDLVGETAALMKYGFGHFERVRVAEAGTKYGQAPVEFGQAARVAASLRDPVYIVRRKGEDPRIDVQPDLKTVEAPVKEGAEVGVLRAYVDGHVAAEGTLVSAAEVRRSPASVAQARSGRNWTLGFFALVGVIGLGYGSSIAKAARIRRSRIKAIMRGANHRG